MRVISGRLKGRDLGRVAEGVRPTTDRVRESLFSSLGSLEGLSVLDLFAGTGALGIEAYSRGASRVVFVEKSRKVVRGIQTRLAALGLEAHEEIRIVALDARLALQNFSREATGGFDVVFVDPPYADKDREQIVEALFSLELLNMGATVVVEGPKGHPLPPLPGVRVRTERRYGDTQLTWLETKE